VFWRARVHGRHFWRKGETAKKVCFVELTSPAEENINLWKIKKREKYIELVEEAKSNGYSACCRTIEVGARGFVSKSSMSVFTMFGIGFRHRETIRRELSKIAIRCSHFIWISRENRSWSHRVMVIFVVIIFHVVFCFCVYII